MDKSLKSESTVGATQERGNSQVKNRAAGRIFFILPCCFFKLIFLRSKGIYKLLSISALLKVTNLTGGYMIITNNELVYQKYKDRLNILFINGSYRDVLVKVRDKIQEGHELLSHPLSSSLKPNETPYKSVIISENKGKLNFDSVYIIENSIMTCDKFVNNKLINFTDKIKEDFKLIDLTVLESALDI